jgi:two-component system sensor histidine kinase/response regulator
LARTAATEQTESLVSLKMGHKIFLLVSVPLIFILAVLALFSLSQRSTVTAGAEADRSDAVLAQTGTLWETMLDAEDNARGYVLTRSPSYLMRFHRSESQVPQLLATLHQLIGEDSGREDQADGIEKAADQRLLELQRSIARVQPLAATKSGIASRSPDKSRNMDELRSRVTAFNNVELHLDSQRDARLARSLDTFNTLLMVCAIAAFGLSLLIMQIFSRVLVKRLAELGDEARAFAEGGAFRGSVQKGNDEISQLQRSFHAMAGTIEEKQTALERYQLLVKTARDVILFVSRDDLRILDANDAAIDAYGYTREELLTMTVRELRSPESRVTLDAEIDRGDADPALFEAYHRRKDGSSFPVEVASRAAEIEGRPVLLSIIRDVTERKRAENEHEKFFDRSNDLMGVANFEGYFSRINSAWGSALGYSVEELTGRPFLEFIHPDDRRRTASTMEAIKRGEAVTSFEIQFARKDGSYVWLAWSAIPSIEEGLVYAVARDVTKRKEIEAELAFSRDQAMEASLLKSQFLANMSHEIRTPMNGIVATSELLMRSKLSGDEREYAGIISESAGALLTIINEILDLSKLEAGKLDLESAEFSPHSVAEGATELVAVQAAQKGLSLRTEIADDLPGIILGDAGRVRQILLNLLGNALKFTERGAVSLRVSLEADDEAEATLRFAVADTGIGLSPQECKRIFEPFTQADGSTSRRYGGTGLGLSISKRLVELMNGEIGVESDQKSGSTFWFTARFAKVGTLAEHSARPSLRGRRLLVVDSDSTSSDNIVRYANSWGVRSVATSNADAVILMLKKGVGAGDPFHFLIVDLSTADLDAWRLSESIARDASLSDTKLILAASLAARERLQATGSFAAYLAKPVKQSQLHDCLVTAMEIGRPRSRVIDKAALTDNVGARILLAEDHAINRRIALAQLEEFHLTADVATNGQEAIDAYEKHRYDIILMDCQMPEVDGFAATRAIRAIQARDGGNVRIIAMTANAMEGDRKTCIDAGMDDYISKPVGLDELRDVLRLAPTPSRLSSQAAQAAGQVLDSAKLRELFYDDAEAIRELLDLSISECRPLAAAMRSAVADQQSSAATEAAHKFKGICGNVGAHELASIGMRIERAAKSSDWASAQDGCSDLEAGMSRFVAAAKVTTDGEAI